MPRLISTLPNQPAEVSGVKFVLRGDGSAISEEVPKEQAERFAAIPGYSIFNDKGGDLDNDGDPGKDNETGGSKKRGRRRKKDDAPDDGAGTEG